MKKTRIRLFLEIATVILLGYVLYSKWINPPEPLTPETVAANEKEEPGRVTGFIKTRTVAEKAGEKPTKKAGDTPPEFETEPTSATSTVPEEPLEEIAVPPTILRGQVLDEQGQLILQPAIIFSQNCRFTARVENGLFAIEVEPGVCTLQARRQEGEYIIESDPVEVEILAELTNELQLILPSLHYGSIGIDVVMHAEVAEVTVVGAESPAAAVGMQPGHFIMEVNGMAAAGMTADDFHAQLSGPVGTQVQLVIVAEAADGAIQEIPVALERVGLE